MDFRGIAVQVVTLVLLLVAAEVFLRAISNRPGLYSVYAQTQRRRYICVMAGTAFAIVSLGMMFYDYGLRGAVQHHMVLFRTNVVYGTFTVVVHILDLLMVLLSPFIVRYISHHPTRFAYAVRRKVGAYWHVLYIQTDDVRIKMNNPWLYSWSEDGATKMWRYNEVSRRPVRR
jgi:hypothetical protein